MAIDGVSAYLTVGHIHILTVYYLICRWTYHWM